MEEFELMVTIGDPITKVAIPKQPLDLTPMQYYAKLVMASVALLTTVAEAIGEGDKDISEMILDTIMDGTKKQLMERVDE